MPRPLVVAFVALFMGAGLAVAGVWFLAGPGWGMIMAALPFFVLYTMIVRGLK